jgi:2-amino-4-hydroxy-6-hydroxymethyldihydropteridine diphosphokinase
MTSVYIGIGSNLEHPFDHVTQAIQDLKALPESDYMATSALYRSAPMGPADQPDYINAVSFLQTRLAALDLLDQLQAIERAHGRNRDGQRWAPRTLDLDLLLYGEKIINDTRLRVPHPGLHERSFVLYPLQDINPDLVIPAYGPLASLIELCPHIELERLDPS